MISKYLSALVVAIGLAFGTTGAVEAASHTWRIQAVFPEADGDWQVTLNGVKKLIEEASNGEIEVKLFPVGMLVEPDSVIDAVANGAIEGGHIIAGMAADRVPSALGTEMPFGVRDPYEHYELHFVWGLNDIMREEYATHNLHLLTAGFSGRAVFESSFPVRSLDDLSGRKIWAIPNALWLTDFGASTVEVPGLDMYSAIRLGTIDGMTWTMSELEVSSLKEVVDYVMMPPLLTPGTHIVLNKNAWDAIGPDMQRAIQNHIAAHQIELSKQYAENDEAAMQAAQEYGVEFITLPPEDVARMKEAAESFWNEIEGLSPHSERMIQSYRAYKEYRGIE